MPRRFDLSPTRIDRRGAVRYPAMPWSGRSAISTYEGPNAVRFTEVAALIAHDGGIRVDDRYKGTTVLEQNYQFDLVSTDKLLQKYVDRHLSRSFAAKAPSLSTVRCYRRRRHRPTAR